LPGFSTTANLAQLVQTQINLLRGAAEKVDAAPVEVR
jgi:hypothetical protein